MLFQDESATDFKGKKIQDPVKKLVATNTQENTKPNGEASAVTCVRPDSSPKPEKIPPTKETGKNQSQNSENTCPITKIQSDSIKDGPISQEDKTFIPSPKDSDSQHTCKPWKTGLTDFEKLNQQYEWHQPICNFSQVSYNQFYSSGPYEYYAGPRFANPNINQTPANQSSIWRPRLPHRNQQYWMSSDMNTQPSFTQSSAYPSNFWYNFS